MDGTSFSLSKESAKNYGDKIVEGIVPNNTILRRKDLSEELKNFIESKVEKLSYDDYVDGTGFENVVSELARIAKGRKKNAIDLTEFFPKSKIDDEIRVLNKDGIKVKSAPKVTPLEQEAKKYKSAEEFVKAKSGNQGIYDKTYDEMIQKNRAGAKPFDYELMELLDAIPETKDGNVKIYRATTNGEILPGDNVSIYDMKQYVDPNNRGLNITAAKMGVTKLSGNKDIKFVEKWIPKEDLYQTDAGTQLYAPNGMKSLTDIWKKANKK